MNFNNALVAKITVKKILSLIDHIQILVTHALGDKIENLTIQDWFDEIRLHLRKVEYSVETAAE